MNAVRLREAAMCFDQLCDAFDEWVLEPDNEESRDYLLGVLMQEEPSHLHALLAAARNIALPILEADPELVERIGILILEGILGDGDLNELARQVLAAISTPTPVEES